MFIYKLIIYLHKSNEILTLLSCRCVKYFISLDVEFSRQSVDGVVTLTTGRFGSEMTSLFDASNIDESIEQALATILKRVSAFQREGSGWVISSLINLKISSAEFDPIGGSSYIPTPKFLATKNALLNIQNFDDDRCFLYSVLAHSHPVASDDNANRANKYKPFLHELNIEKLKFPLETRQIEVFEKQNPDYSINVNIFDEETKKIIPEYASRFRGRKFHVNLLLLAQEEKRHYLLIRNLSRLVAHRSDHKDAVHVCPYCLHCFYTEECLQRHIPECSVHGLQRLKYPDDEHNKLKFKNYIRSMRVPFAVYCDFEAFLPKIEDEASRATRSCEAHVPSGFCALRVSSFPHLNNEKAVLFSGEGVMDGFFKYLETEQEKINLLLNVNKPMNPLTPQQKLDFDLADHCFCCGDPLTVKIKHHCHVTGDFIAAACNDCNLQLKFRRFDDDQKDKRYVDRFFIPVVFHNLKNYDSHIILKNLSAEFAKKRDLSVIATNTERYISFQVGNVRFIDSLAFLNSSLDSLVKNTPPDKFLHTRRHHSDDTKLKLTMKKGTFPYEYMDDISKFDDIKLPPIEAFYSHLADESISEEDYEHAQNVWTTFGMKTMKDYHDLYLLTDVLLLSDVFENFRDMSMNYYKLDPLHYFTLPGLSFDACLRMTDVELDLITDPEQMLFIERGIRGGVSVISNRHGAANNRYDPDNYDPTLPSSYLMYLDCNNLYGHSMSQYLPTGNFNFLTEQQIENFDISTLEPTDETGYFLEVDLEYPMELHDTHNDYPLAPESVKVVKDMLSPYALNLYEKLYTGSFAGCEKLIPNLRNKERYVVHYVNLQQYIKLGLKVTKTHRILEFSQSPWLKKYIDFNTEKRKMATSSFERDFFKLANNAIFGKTMENLRKRVDVRIVTKAQQARRFIARPTFESFNIINEGVTVIKLRKAVVYLNKPLYIGMAILDLSKSHMYDFHYNVVIPKYSDKAKLLFTDTDSLFYHIETADIYSDMKSDAKFYDTSDYPKEHMLYDPTNAKQVGLMKDECHGVPPVEFVGLRSKMYSILLPHGQEKKTAKGVKKSFVKNHLRHHQYRDTLTNSSKSTATFRTIRSQCHCLQTIEITKTSLCAYDDKRYLLSDGVHSRAYGHWRDADNR